MYRPGFRHSFFSAPHRLMFAGGAAQSVAVMLFWATELAARQFFDGMPGWPWPATWAHAGLMVYGVFPWFIFGFLMTALPKWMGAGPLRPGQYIPPFLLLAVGWSLFYAGLAWPVLALGGLVLAASGWVLGGVALWQAMRDSMNSRQHAWAVLAALALGVVGLAAYALALGRTSASAYRIAVEFGVWGFLVPVFFIVLHRMLPFFTSAVARAYAADSPMWALWVMLACLAGHGLLTLGGVLTLRWLPDALAAAIAWHLAIRWGTRAAFQFPMVAMLHLGFVWLAVAMSLFAAQGFGLLFGLFPGGLIPLHALGLGFFASILIAMATRVTRGHSGRPVGEDRWAWRLFLALQPVILLRLAGEYLPALNLAAALGWLLIFGLWTWVYLPMYLQPRPDGQPG